ncbi:MAG: ornithine cyclodeaminase family protein [Acidimicrobiia bacterium]|nr:ornithine cyclodeaminase family protein [Acidimicrobiia bacterium]
MAFESLPFISRDRLNDLLPMIDAIDALDGAFSAGIPALPVRTVHAIPEGQLLMMPAWSDRGIGVKLITYNPENASRNQPTVQGVYVLFEPDTASPLAVFDGSAITELRTAAVSGVATRHLSKTDATRLLVYGSGVQARSHIAAMRAVRAIELVQIVSGTPANAVSLADELRQRGVEALAVDSPGLVDADIVCLCTTSPTPVINAGQLPSTIHINAIGSFQPHTREVDSRTVSASTVYVEDRAAAMEEAGDLIIPEQEGAWDRNLIGADLHELVSGQKDAGGGRTLFKGVGLAYEDLIVATAAYQASR